MIGSTQSRWWRRPAVMGCILTTALVLWLAPITLLWRMPAGGDVTSFFMPLMAYYRGALAAGRLPLWNELWGFGFPMLAESQAGVFYPPHLLLFGLFDIELAYSMNLVLHHLMCGFFMVYCARSFGLNPVASVLAGLVFAGNGFFIIHFPHQWSYTTGAWMPLAVALMWRAVRPGGDPAWSRLRSALGLAAVLGIQMLAGHYQVAFYTQVVVLWIGAVCTMQYVSVRLRRRRGRGPSRMGMVREYRSWGHPAAILTAAVTVCAAFLLAAAQLLPTYELIQIALPDGRDFEYLSGFANSPLHAVSYLLPTLFHVNPLWRPIAWDPFHTSPEECFSYVGLLPLCFGLAASWRWRHEPRVRLWLILALVTFLLSLGPYLPGFRALIQLPGFDGFRASSRWSIATALFLALLAARGLDGLRASARFRYWLARFVILFTVVAGIAFTAVLAILRPASGGSEALLAFAENMRQIVSPWPAEPGVPQLARMAETPAGDERTYAALSKIDRVTPDAARPDEPRQQIVVGNQVVTVRAASLAGEWRKIILQEFAPPLIVMALTVTAGWLGSRKRRLHPLLAVGIVVADLGSAAWLRPVEYSPRRPLTQQSPALAFLTERQGTRGVDIQPNFAMIAGAAPVQSYRTVNIPILDMISPIIDNPKLVHNQLKDRMVARANIGWRLYAGKPPSQKADPHDEYHPITDPFLGRLLYGPMLDSFPELAEFHFRDSPAIVRSTAWWIDRENLIRPGTRSVQSPQRNSEAMVLFQSGAVPLTMLEQSPHAHSFSLAAASPGSVIITSLYYPGWEAALTSNGRIIGVPVNEFAGCQAIRLLASGEYRLDLSFRSKPFERGRWLSFSAAAVWSVMLLFSFVWSRRGV